MTVIKIITVKSRKCLFILVPLIFIIFCSNDTQDPPSSFITSHGIKVYAVEGVNYEKESIEFVTDSVIIALETRLPQTFKSQQIYNKLIKYHGLISLHIKAERIGVAGSCATSEKPHKPCLGFQCDVSNNGWCVGLYDGRDLSITVSFKNCIAKSSLTHELIHLFGDLMTGNADPSHENSLYFSHKNSALKTADKIIKKKMCNDSDADNENP